MTDATGHIALHESGHAVAAYMLGLHFVGDLEVRPRGGAMDVFMKPQGSGERFAMAVISLAGDALMIALGLRGLGTSHADEENAARMIVGSSEEISVPQAHALLSIAEAAVGRMVEGDHFQELALALSAELEHRKFMDRVEVLRFLRAHEARQLEEVMKSMGATPKPAPAPKPAGSGSPKGGPWKPAGSGTK